MKSYDVYMDTFVNVMLPDDVDTNSNEGVKALYEAAITKYRERMADLDQISLSWERYEDGDTAP